MNLAIRTIALGCFLTVGSLIVPAQQTLSGSYTTTINSLVATKESYTFAIRQDGTTDAQADILAGSNSTHTSTRTTKNGPESFVLSIANLPAITTEFKDGTARVTIADQPAREIKTQASLVLENGVWHHFISLLKQYDANRGGNQAFTAFMPSTTSEFPLAVEAIDAPSFKVKGQTIPTEHYKARTNKGMLIEIWANSDRVPLVISIPAQNVRVIRGGSEDLADAILGKPAAEDSNHFTSEEVTFANGDVKLAGTLTIPKSGKAPYPAAVIITGSGGQDRDGAVGLFNLYKLIAERLSSAGIAVLRADDRGVGKSTMPNPSRPSSYRDLIKDSHAAFEYLTQRAEIDKTRIALVGHSEGAETALTIAAEDARVAAIILLAGASRPVDRVAVEQSIYQTALQGTIDPGDLSKLPDAAKAVIDRFDSVRNQKPPASGDDANAWFREHLASDPAALAKRVKCPVLLLNGERDVLVLAYNAIELAQALTSSGNKQVRLRILPNLTHLFTAAAPEKNAPADQAPTVSQEMLQTVSDWASKVLASPR
jgi:pimeloyl-ACP methyl ester carboxylesterase